MARTYVIRRRTKFSGKPFGLLRVELRKTFAVGARLRAIAVGFSVGLLALGVINVGGFPERTARAQSTSTSQSPSWFDSFTSGIKQGFTKIGNVFNPKGPAQPKPEDSAIALSGNGKPDADLYVAVARLHESSNRLAEAEKQYLLALKEKPDYLPALMGYAQLKDHLGKPDDAIRLYQQAAKAHPNEAGVYNNLGLCYARYHQPKEAVTAMQRAIQLEPRNPRYHNNFATVLVDQGRLADAVEQLRPVHGDAGAYYNVGYLLNKRGQPRIALQYFALALQADPMLTPARQMFDALQQQLGQARAAQPVDAGVTVGVPTGSATGEPPMVTQQPLQVLPTSTPLPPSSPLAQRLPPANPPGMAVSSAPNPPGNSYPAESLAPLPPPTAYRPSSGVSSDFR
jgi:Tfp pilus assembly protein PilF